MERLDRISFGTDGWRDRRDAFTDERVRAVGHAFLTYLHEQGHADGPIAVGYDARPDSPDIAATLAACATEAGHDALVATRDCPTPAVAALIDERDLPGGFMVTASHNPPTYNGIKVIPHGGAPALPYVTDRLEALLGRADPTGDTEGATRDFDYVGYHVDTVTERAPASLDGLHVAYDAMHGSGRVVTDTLCEAAGATVTRLRCSRADDFGGSAPEPTADRLEVLIEHVVEGDADLGLATDGDADRVAVVTERGFVDANELFAVMYDHLLDEHDGAAVRTVSTTYLIDRIAEAHGETVHETPVGFKWVGAAMGDHDALIGGEDSGGFTVRWHVHEKDGPLAGLLAAGAHRDRAIDERLDALHDRYGSIHHASRSLDCPEGDKAAVMDRLHDVAPRRFADREVASTNDADGIKFLLDDGSWILVRPSGTEPKLRLYAEAASADLASTLLAAAAATIEPLVESVA